MRAFLVLAIVAVFGLPAVASSPEEVVEWSRTGVPEEEILKRLKRDPPNRRLSAREAFKLKKSAGLSDAVVQALIGATTPPGRTKEIVMPSDEDLSDHEDASDGIGSRTFGIFEIGGGFTSVSVDDTSVMSARILPGLSVVASGVTVGVEGDFVVAPDRKGTSAIFGMAGAAFPLDKAEKRAVWMRLAGRVGYSVPDGVEGAVAYGFALSLLGRSGRLLAGAGMTATWSGEPAVSTIAVDLRLGTWF